MHTVDLNSNKLLLVFNVLLGLILFSLSQLEVIPLQPIKWLGLVLIMASLFLVCLVQGDKLFVHIDKAGVSYGLGFTVKYIHQEFIKSITRKPGLFGDVLKVTTHDGKVFRFYAWQVSETDFVKAERLLAL